MATLRVVSVRWHHRYRLYFVIFGVILIIQLFLALCFYNIHSSDEEEKFLYSIKVKNKEKAQQTHKESRPRNAHLDPLANKYIEDYAVDDEDSPSNIWEKAPKDSSSRNISPREPDKQKAAADVAVPKAKDLQDLKIIQLPSASDKGTSQNANGTKRTDDVLNLDELDFKPWCNITIREAISAIHRATTQACKQEIANITCLMLQGTLYPERLPRYCPLKGIF